MIRLLSLFSKDEVEVIEENDKFLSLQQYLEKELASAEEGTANYTTVEALENRLYTTYINSKRKIYINQKNQDK